jgi:CheY-like chemotaxis protein
LDSTSGGGGGIVSVIGNTFLVVEDNEDDVFALRWALKKAKIRNPLQVVVDGREALDYFKGLGKFADRETHPLPCLVFLDLKLPYVNGFEVLEWVREQPEFSALAVVILSGSDEARDHERANGLNASFYLVKPATPDELSDLLKAIPGSEWDECDIFEDEQVA